MAQLSLPKTTAAIRQTDPVDPTHWHIVQFALKRVPSFRFCVAAFALSVLAAAICKLGIDFRVLGIVSACLLVFGVLIFVLHRVTGFGKNDLKIPGMTLVWMCIASLAMTMSSLFWRWPIDLFPRQHPIVVLPMTTVPAAVDALQQFENFQKQLKDLNIELASFAADPSHFTGNGLQVNAGSALQSREILQQYDAIIREDPLMSDIERMDTTVKRAFLMIAVGDKKRSAQAIEQLEGEVAKAGEPISWRNKVNYLIFGYAAVFDDVERAIGLCGKLENQHFALSGVAQLLMEHHDYQQTIDLLNDRVDKLDDLLGPSDCFNTIHMAKIWCWYASALSARHAQDKTADHPDALILKAAGHAIKRCSDARVFTLTEADSDSLEEVDAIAHVLRGTQCKNAGDVKNGIADLSDAEGTLKALLARHHTKEVEDELEFVNQQLDKWQSLPR